MMKELSVLIYLAGNNDLSAAASRHWGLLRDLSIPQGVALSVQYDTQGGGGKTFRLGADSSGRRIVTLKPRDSSSPDHLAEFLCWSMARAPAKRQVLLLFCHSDGFIGLLESDASGRTMALPAFRGALEGTLAKTGRPLDMLIFDCCFMAMAEVAYELKKLCPLILASQDELPGDGLPLVSLLEVLFRPAGREARGMRQIAASLVRSLAMEALSGEGMTHRLFVPQFCAIETAPLTELARQFRLFTAGLCENLECCGAVAEAGRRAQRSGNFAWNREPYRSFVDVWHFCTLLLENLSIPEAIRETAGRIAVLVESLVVENTRWGDETRNSHGLSFYFPRTSRAIPGGAAKKYGYGDLLWERDTSWGRSGINSFGLWH
ncbi:MAG: clostripain-related cysteine peptidase [Candidatus Eremiobacteraeota bacterium]|nr:clostripain-related cysteine peptidase [Candidatus Eremiobacteraeota bacterium]